MRSSVEYAYRHVPYYRETMDRLGLRPSDFHDASDLARLPVIERQHLQRNPDYFVARGQPDRGGVKLQSGGSTGEPVTVLRDLFDHEQGVFRAVLHARREACQRHFMVNRSLKKFAHTAGQPRQLSAECNKDSWLRLSVRGARLHPDRARSHGAEGDPSAASPLSGDPTAISGGFSRGLLGTSSWRFWRRIGLDMQVPP